MVQRLINVFRIYEIFSKRKCTKFSSEDIEKVVVVSLSLSSQVERSSRSCFFRNISDRSCFFSRKISDRSCLYLCRELLFVKIDISTWIFGTCNLKTRSWKLLDLIKISREYRLS